MSSRASGGALAACLIAAAVVGFTGGAYVGAQTGDDGPGGGPASQTTPPAAGTEEPPGTEAPVPDGLTLTAEETSAAPQALIPISGALTPVESGVDVKVQRRLEGGDWEDFPNQDRPLTLTTRDDGTFSGSIAPQRPGRNNIRVVRVDDDSVVSNEVAITIDG